MYTSHYHLLFSGVSFISLSTGLEKREKTFKNEVVEASLLKNLLSLSNLDDNLLFWMIFINNG
jgi:hypothetical protein